MAETTFAQRLAYVRWLRDRGRVKSESDKAFAEAVSVGYDWLHKWKESEAPPVQRPQIKALVHGLADLGVTEGWLIDGEGTPPEPKMWREWFGRAQPTAPALRRMPVAQAPEREAAKRRGGKRTG